MKYLCLAYCNTQQFADMTPEAIEVRPSEYFEQP
jgi:hypothetical protein